MKYNTQSEIRILIDGKAIHLTGNLTVPEGAENIVIFAHGRRSGRFSPRNNFVAHVLNERKIATLLIDLLTPEEDAVFDDRFDIELLAQRLEMVTEYVRGWSRLKDLAIGYFGASAGGAAALKAAAHLNDMVQTVVLRGGRTNLAGSSLLFVEAPTLLIAGALDRAVVTVNEAAYRQLNCEKKLVVVEGATHFFPEPGKLEKVANLAADWFEESFARYKENKQLSKVNAS